MAFPNLNIIALADLRGDADRRVRRLPALLSIVSAVLFVCAYAYYVAASLGGHEAAGERLLKLGVALFIYLMSHAARFCRLSVIVGAGRLRRFLSLYVYVAACSSLMPFKLGELSRINELAWWTGSYWRGVLVVWVERTFDVIALTIIVIYLAVQSLGISPAIWPLLVLMAVFAVISIILFFVLPEQLIGLNLHVIRNYKGMKAVRILAILDRISELLLQFRPMVSGKLVTVTVLTLLIWALELTAVTMLFNDEALAKGALVLLTQFSEAFSLGIADESEILTQFNEIRLLGIGAFGIVSLLFYFSWRRRCAR